MFYERYPELDRLLLSYPGAERDFQPVWGWDRYLVAGKMYAGLLFVAKHSDPRYKGHMFLSLKADPAEAEFYRTAIILTNAHGSASVWTAHCRKMNLPISAAAVMIW